VDWLLREHRDWIDAEYCINLDGGDLKRTKTNGCSPEFKPAKKFTWIFNSNPESCAIARFPARTTPSITWPARWHGSNRFRFLVKINEITRSYFEKNAALMTGQVAADMRAVAKQPPDPTAVQRLSAVPYYNSLLHTTCVATMLSGGHAPNALPQTARCQRQLPHFSWRRSGRSSQDARARGERSESQNQRCSTTLSGRKSRARRPGSSSPLLPEVTQAMEKVLSVVWPGVPLVATMVHRRH